MILQQTHRQITLSEEEEWIAWIKQIEILQNEYKDAKDQGMSGHKIHGLLADGTECVAELTKEELFELFLKRSLLVGRKAAMDVIHKGETGVTQKEDAGLLEIEACAAKGRTKKADITLCLPGFMRIEGIRVHEGKTGKRIVMPCCYQKDGKRINLIEVKDAALQEAILSAYVPKEKAQGVCAQYRLQGAGVTIRLRDAADEAKRLGMQARIEKLASVEVGGAFEISHVRLIRGRDGALHVAWPAETVLSNGSKKWHNLVLEHPRRTLSDAILEMYRAGSENRHINF